MRFETIRFEKVGPFDDTQIRFNPNAHVHLIHGPNEAGKTSALKQILAFLFEFKGQSGDDFTHDYKHHRVHAGIVSMANKPLSEVTRKKGNKDTLLGAKEQDLHPSNMKQDDFDRLFAIDKMRLERGSEELFSGTSDLKAVLFESMSGMPSVNEVRKWLRANKVVLLTPRKGRIMDLLRKIIDATDCEKKELTRAAIHADQTKDYREICETLEKVEVDLKGQRREKSRLERLLRGTGLMTDLRQKEADLLQIGSVPRLDSDFESVWEKARADRTKCEGSLASEEESHGRLAKQFENAPRSDFDNLQLQKVDRLIELKGHVESAIRDRPGCEDQSRVLQTKRNHWVAEWFPSKVDQDLFAWLPEDRLCDQINDAANLWETTASTCTDFRKGFEESRHDLAELEQKIALLPALEDLATLKSVLEDLELFGDTEPTLNKHGAKLKTGVEDILAQANRLAPPVADLLALDDIACPTGAEIQRLVAQWKKQEEEEADCTKAVASCKNELTIKQKELERLQAGINAGVSRAEYADTKELRDQTWDWIRGERKGIVSKKEAVNQLIESAGVGLDLDETMTGLIKKVDQQADTLLFHSELVSKCELLTSELVHWKQNLKAFEADASQLKGKRESMHTDLGLRWESWKAGPTVIRDIHGLPEWFKKVGELQNGLKDNRELQLEQDAKVAGLAHLGKRLSEALGETGSVQNLRRIARTKIEQREKLVVDRSKLVASRDTQQKTVDKARRQQEQNQEQLQSAQENWENLVRTLGDPVHEGERTRLAGCIKKIRSDEKERIGLLERVGNMTGTIETFLAHLAEATQSFGRGPGPWDLNTWQDALQELQQLAQADRDKQTVLKRITEEWEQAKARLGQTTLQRDQAQFVLAALMQQTKCATEEEISGLLERLKKKNHLEGEIDRQRSQLAQEMKKSVNDYQGELDDFKGADMEQSIEDLDQLANHLDDQAKGFRSKKQDMERIRVDLAQADSAAMARQQAEDFKVQLEGAVREWKINHLSLLCLEQAIEKNRQSGGETPLSRAGQFFKTMTHGRFEELDFEDDGMQLTLKVRRAKADDPMVISALDNHGLSEGTADQLWLALRLAGIEARVDQMIAEGFHPMPIILDDVLVSFDEERTTAALQVLAKIGQKTQVILFTHHQFVSDLAQKTLGDRADLIELQRG